MIDTLAFWLLTGNCGCRGFRPIAVISIFVSPARNMSEASYSGLVNMQKAKKTIDFSYAKSPLFVRQMIAVAFGIPLDREFTWEYLRSQICKPDNSFVPTEELHLIGVSGLAIRLSGEYESLRSVWKELQAIHPNLKIQVLLH